MGVSEPEISLLFNPPPTLVPSSPYTPPPHTSQRLCTAAPAPAFSVLKPLLPFRSQQFKKNISFLFNDGPDPAAVRLGRVGYHCFGEVFSKNGKHGKKAKAAPKQSKSGRN